MKKCFYSSSISYLRSSIISTATAATVWLPFMMIGDVEDDFEDDDAIILNEDADDGDDNSDDV